MLMTLFALDFKHYPLQYTTQNEMQKNGSL